MSSLPQSDRSSLSALIASQPLDVHWREFKNSVRYQGSYFLNLNKPAKFPEGSRKYIKGDPVRFVDWKAYSRTDQLVIREKRDEASSTVIIGIDASETMRWPNQATLQEHKLSCPTKIEFALRVALNIAHIHLMQGDLVQLWVSLDGHAEEAQFDMRPRSPSDIVGIFNRLADKRFELTKADMDFNEGSIMSGRKDIAYWVGDGLSKNDIWRFLEYGRRRVFFHTLSSLEIDIDWVKQDRCYFDEDLQKKEFQGNVLKYSGGYDKAMIKWQKQFKNKSQDQNCNYFLLTDNTAIDELHRNIIESK